MGWSMKGNGGVTDTFSGAGVGAVAGNAIMGPGGAIVGGAIGAKNGNSGLSAGWDRVTGAAGTHAKRKDYNESVAAQRQEQEGVLGTMAQNDAGYYDKMKKSSGDYQTARNNTDKPYLKKLDEYQAQAENQGKDAQLTYTNTIAPKLKGIMEDAQRDIPQAYDRTTGRYNAEGERVRSMGLQDAGVMSALGAQATSQQLGSTPGLMTGGQMAAISGANQSQSQQAYARAQQQMMRLREQGVGAGIDQENIAKDRYTGSVNNIQNAQGINQAQQQGYRGEANGYGTQAYDTRSGANKEDYGIASGLNSLQYGQQQNQANAHMAVINGNYGQYQQGIAGAMQSDAAKTQAWQSGLFGLAGAGIGATAGGMSGAAAGKGMAQPPPASPPPNYGGYYDYQTPNNGQTAGGYQPASGRGGVQYGMA